MVNPEVVGSIPTKTQKIENPIENPNLRGFELHRPSSKGTTLLLQVIKAIIIHSFEYFILVTGTFFYISTFEGGDW